MPRIHDLAAVRPALRIDPAWSLYALADLSPEHARFAEWYAPDDSGRCAVLVYRGFGRPIFLDSGDLDGVRRTIAEIAEREEGFYLSIRQPTLELLRQAGYEVAKPKPMVRMRLDASRFAPGTTDAVMRLTVADLTRLQALYSDGDASGEAPEFFLPSMLERGIYYAVPDAERLASVAGTHVIAPEEGVAGVGAVYTRRDARRHGYARQATAAVVGALLDQGLGVICLNVVAENHGAITLYRALGFEPYCEYFEGEAVRGG